LDSFFVQRTWTTPISIDIKYHGADKKKYFAETETEIFCGEKAAGLYTVMRQLYI
jgi:hypothetical protein